MFNSPHVTPKTSKRTFRARRKRRTNLGKKM